MTGLGYGQAKGEAGDMLGRLKEFIRRNLLFILFGLLIVGQLLTWRALVTVDDSVTWGLIRLRTEIERSTDHNCGSVHNPCRVMVLPDH